MSGAGKFTAHGSVKPDSIMLTEHAEKAASAAFSISDSGIFGSEKKRREIGDLKTLNGSNYCCGKNIKLNGQVLARISVASRR